VTDEFYFDANCRWGLSTKPNIGSLDQPDAVQVEGRRCGVDKLLAYHTQAKEWSPELGNAALGPVMDEHDEVVGCWVVDPALARDGRTAQRLVQEIVAAGFRAVRLCPDAANHDVDLSTAGFLTGALADRSVPLIIDTAIPDWKAIAALATSAPRLPVIVSGFGYRHGRTLLPVLDSCPNMAVESSTFVAHGAVEELVTEFSASRIVFGTNAPIYSIGAAVARIAYADVSDDDRRLIAGGTLLHLIEQVQQ
jgi:predicted TIM-barrel fold metal-dependent hydrolase